MVKTVKVLSLPFIILASCFCESKQVTPLTLKKALFLDGGEGTEPSGLTIYQNTLFTVSDDHDNTIFRIRLTDDKAVLEPHIQFDLPDSAEKEGLDFEGITCDEAGNFYLVSESAFKILRITADGKDVSWVTPSLKSAGMKEGLFQKENANLEGIALIRDTQFVLCAEREPRGIIQLDLEKIPEAISVVRYQESQFEIETFKQRPPDFSGLFFDRGVLYVLVRGAHAICRLSENNDSFEGKDFWSYQSIENSETLRYSDMTYGHAEGLAMDTQNIYIVMDNGGDFRAINPEDRRPLLLILERP